MFQKVYTQQHYKFTQLAVNMLINLVTMSLNLL